MRRTTGSSNFTKWIIHAQANDAPKGPAGTERQDNFARRLGFRRTASEGLHDSHETCSDATPRGLEHAWNIAAGDSETAVNGQFLELEIAPESNPGTIRRKER
jgi:hypothetical protein